MPLEDWRPSDAPDLEGLVVVVTGASSGLGEETARAAALRGAHVVLATRSAPRTGATMSRIRAVAPGASLEHLPLDLTTVAGTVDAVLELRRRHPRIDRLVANAGVMATPRTLTTDGYELQTAVNHLGHQAFVVGLLDQLEVAEDPRIVVVSSELHRSGRVDPDDIAWRRRTYRRWGAYAASKLANLLFTAELDRRLASAGRRTRVWAAHPGFAATGLQSAGVGMTPGLRGRAAAAAADRLTRLVAQPARTGALPQLLVTIADAGTLATAVPRGSYVGPAGAGGLRGGPTLVTPSARARDHELARAVWDGTELLTGVRSRL